MDRRLLVALALTALVILVFQVVFPTPVKRPGAVRPDSMSAAATPVVPPAKPGALGAGQSAAAGGTAGTATTSGQNGATPAGHGAVAGTASVGAPVSAPAAPSIPPDTTDIRTAHAVFRMSNVGAAPIGVTMLDYKNLRPGASTPKADLGVPGAPMLRYRVLAPHDTLDLSSVTFRDTRTTAPDGTPVLTYQATVRDANVTIAYTFDGDGYLAHVNGKVQGVDGGYLLVDLPDGFHSSEADTLDDQRAYGYVVKRGHEDPQATLFDKLKPGETVIHPAPVDWVALKSKYFVVGLLAPNIPANDSAAAQPFAQVELLGGPRPAEAKTATVAAATAVQPLKGNSFAFDFFAGPQEWRLLHAVDRDFEDVNPYGGFAHAVLQPFVTIIVRMLIWMREHLNLSYGWIIIIFGIVIRVFLWPLNQRAMRSQLKMQVLQPELQAVQTRYKNDPQKLQDAMMKVYKDHGMSPFSPVAGCLPMLIPMPILFTLYFVLRNTIALRGVSFLWLHDITQADPLYILPLLMGATSYLVSWIGMRNTPPNPQTKMMSYMFPAMMTFFFFRISAGLNLYYAVQNMATLPQQWLLSRERAKSAAATGTGTARVQGRGVSNA
jgi:YidC/Oxa1 family membrane protein insertase